MYGTAMGSPVSVTVANLVMEDVEERALSSYYTDVILWKKFVDDACTSLPTDTIQHFLSHLHSIERTIKFKVEMKNENRIFFLDAVIMHHSDSGLSTVVYCKKTHTGKYLAYDSHHPTSHKIAVAKMLFTRAENMCSTNI